MSPPVNTEALRVAIEATTFEAEMVRYIKEHFSGALGADAELLDSPGGLDALAAKLHARFKANLAR